MVDNGYSTNNCKSLKTSIGSIIKNPEMLTFILNHFTGFQLAIRDSRIASQFTVIANHFFLFLIKSRIKKKFFFLSRKHVCLFYSLLFA